MENTEQFLNNAINFINEEKFEEAKGELCRVLEVEPDNFEAYKHLGLCEINLDNLQEAMRAFARASQINENDAVVLYYLACTKSNLGEKQEAIRLLNRVIDLRQEYQDARKSLAMIYVETGQLDNAIKTITDGLNNPLFEPDYSIYYILATSYMLKNDYDNAIKYLKSALELSETQVSVMNSLATCYMNTQNHKEAIAVLQKAYQINPEDSLTVYNLGICCQVMEDYKSALLFLQKAYQLDPSITMLASLAFCALKSGEFELAVNLYGNLTAAYPNNTQYRLSYIEALEGTGDYQKALDNTEILLGLDERNVALVKKKGTYLRKLGRNGESCEAFQTLVNRGKIDVEVYYNIAYNLVEMQDFDGAKNMFKKCILLEPDNPYAHKDLGVLYLKMNLYDWAVDEMKKAIELEGDVAEFHYSLGVSYMMLSKIEEAKEAFLEALKYEANDPNCLAYLGYAYMLDRNLDKAEEILKSALKIDPNNFLAKVHIAKLYFQEQKWEVAKEFLTDTIEKVDDDEVKNMLGVCCMKLEDYEGAMGIFHKLAHKYPKNHILLTDLAKCELKCGKKDEALEHLRQALMIFDDYQEALDLLEEINCGKQ